MHQNTRFVSYLFVSQAFIHKRSLQFPAGTPNYAAHYAAGDIVSTPLIKRSGPAQVMGSIAATNIVASLLAAEDGLQLSADKLRKLPKGMPPTMSLAIGTQAVTIRQGLNWGKDVKQRAFGDGLGIDGK
jgi:apoptosis-inducing factor 2